MPSLTGPKKLKEKEEIERAERVELTNDKVFYTKYKRVDKNALPANKRIRKTYRANHHEEDDIE